jgi:hypothetical protein
MSVLNRRNAVFGWLAYQVGKRVIKQKAKQAVPTIDTETKRPNKSAIALVAATIGVLAFWKKRSGGDEAPPADAA